MTWESGGKKNETQTAEPPPLDPGEPSKTRRAGENQGEGNLVYFSKRERRWRYIAVSRKKHRVTKI